jgi:hypothetical protein
MSLHSGARLGSYEIVGALGAGGMGEVYRARDPKLQRDVAIKALPPAFASDPERVARFERGAQALAVDVYVQPVPATGRKWRVSPNGGTSPYWSRDSRELFFGYLGDLYAAKITSDGASPPTLIVRDVVESNPSRGTARRFAVSPDGQRFLAVTAQTAARDTPLTVVLNWPELLRR